MIKNILLIIFILSIADTFSLETNSKFLAKIMDISKTKKTIRVNRGLEFKLSGKEHVKISTTSEIVARAVVVKMSPNRSIWSIYKIYNKEKLEKNVVYTFKVTDSIKLTTDKTRSLKKTNFENEKDKNRKLKDRLVVTQEDKEEDTLEKKTKKSFVNLGKQQSKHDNIDYKNLEEEYSRDTRDKTYDWKSLDESDRDLLDTNDVDFSKL